MALSSHEAINGGPHLPFKRSIRGRMHLLMTERAAHRQLAKVDRRRFSRTEAILILGFGLIQTTVAVLTLLVVLRHG